MLLKFNFMICIKCTRILCAQRRRGKPHKISFYALLCRSAKVKKTVQELCPDITTDHLLVVIWWPVLSIGDEKQNCKSYQQQCPHLQST